MESQRVIDGCVKREREKGGGREEDLCTTGPVNQSDTLTHTLIHKSVMCVCVSVIERKPEKEI